MGTPISQLPAAGALTGAEIVPLVQSGVTSRTTSGALGLTYSSGMTIAGTGAANSTALNAAMTAASVLGGDVLIPPGTYDIGTILTIPSNVRLRGKGVRLHWTGGASVFIQTATTSYTERCGIIDGIALDVGSASIGLALYSLYDCNFYVTFYGTSQTNTLCALLCNTTGTVNPDGNLNCIWSYFKLINRSSCGTFLSLNGNSAVSGQVVTANQFEMQDTAQGGCYIAGVDMVKWCDSNSWIGQPVFELLGTTAKAVIVNSNAATSDRGVYANVFTGGMAINSFGSPGGDARTGVVVGLSHSCRFGYIEANPVPAGGTITLNSNVISLQYAMNQSATQGEFFENFFGTSVGIGAAKDASVSLYLSNFALRGANQRGIRVSDTFSATATGEATGVLVFNSLAASTAVGTYAGLHVSNLSLGSGASATFNVGVLVDALTSGTNNYGVQSKLAAASGRINFYASGTADNFFEGILQHGSTAEVADGTGTVTMGNLAPGTTALVIKEWRITKNAAGSTRWIPLMGP